jgi:hypothetical protein
MGNGHRCRKLEHSDVVSRRSPFLKNILRLFVFEIGMNHRLGEVVMIKILLVAFAALTLNGGPSKKYEN